MNYCDKEKEREDATKNDPCVVDTDNEFQHYVINNLFNNGVHAWWLIGTLGCLTVLSIVFTFFSLFIDTRNLFPVPPADLLGITPGIVHDAEACKRLRTELEVNDETLERVATMAQSERDLDKR